MNEIRVGSSNALNPSTQEWLDQDMDLNHARMTSLRHNVSGSSAEITFEWMADSSADRWTDDPAALLCYRMAFESTSTFTAHRLRRPPRPKGTYGEVYWAFASDDQYLFSTRHAEVRVHSARVVAEQAVPAVRSWWNDAPEVDRLVPGPAGQWSAGEWADENGVPHGLEVRWVEYDTRTERLAMGAAAFGSRSDVRWVIVFDGASAFDLVYVPLPVTTEDAPSWSLSGRRGDEVFSLVDGDRYTFYAVGMSMSVVAGDVWLVSAPLVAPE